jgi:hypothetical protein
VQGELIAFVRCRNQPWELMLLVQEAQLAADLHHVSGPEDKK